METIVRIKCFKTPFKGIISINLNIHNIRIQYEPFKTFKNFKTFQTFNPFKTFQPFKPFQSFKKIFEPIETFKSFKTFEPFKAVKHYKIAPFKHLDLLKHLKYKYIETF